jgi:DNA-binding transcriptional regulator YbjK
MRSRRRRHGRWGQRPAPRAPKDLNEILERREAKRSALLATIVASLSPDGLTHETVAELADVPVGYLRWRYPSADDLTAVTSASARRAS